MVSHPFCVLSRPFVVKTQSQATLFRSRNRIMTLDRNRIREHLENFDLHSLFIEELGWDHGGTNTEAPVAGHTYALQAVAQKRGMVAFQYVADSVDAFPDYSTRQKIERKVVKTVREHLIVYAPHDRSALYWQWVKREPGRSDRNRQQIYHRGQSGEPLIQKLEHIAFTLEEEENTHLVDVTGRVRAAFDVDKVTKKFYERFKKEHQAFLRFIEGIGNVADQKWYASLMLNRMMFIYFIQKRRFLDGDPNYLRDRLEKVRQQQGGGNFHSFYRLFLLRLFHEGLGQPKADRAPELMALLGKVPYLNGGLFDVHDLERDNPEIHIPDEAFQKIFDFFDAYQWHLDDRPLRNDNEINPDVLGYIFEKYINQKQMGAYYTKEDITGYISRNTIIPFLFDRAKKECSIAFKHGGGVWRLLQDDPDRYFHEAVRHGITYDIHTKKVLKKKRELPPEIAAGLDDVSKRGGWNKPAPRDYALPTETWREHVARRRRYEEIHAKLAAGEVTSINDLITYNLDIEKFAQDVITNSEGPELIRAFWKAITKVSILDPTCGSGAFLFAALNILEPIYTACLEAMQGLSDDLKRSGRKHRPEKMRDIRNILEQVQEHASESYFIFKSIIINNLYGVDIMEEAVEICKLRLFLKLVAQLDSFEQIEPLPDIDFNIRPGNTLVGFTSLDEVKRAIQGDWVYELSLPGIEERAEIADRAFRQFREMQTAHGMDADKFAKEKVKLRRRLDDLRAELDQYLSGEYGVKDSDTTAFEQWRDSHPQPFHWFVEFYGIMQRGGFDVIIGNPPYVEYRAVKKEYTVARYDTLSCGNLYAFVLERSYDILRTDGCMGMIAQLSLSCTERMAPIQDKLSKHSSNMWFAHFDDRPAKLFDGLQHIRATIILAQKGSSDARCTYSNCYSRWRSEARLQLFDSLGFTDVSSHSKVMRGSIPKIGHEIGLKLLESVASYSNLRTALVSGRAKVYYHNAPQYWVRAMDFAPYFWNERDGEKISAHVKSLALETKTNAAAVVAALNSSLFYYWFLVLSNCRDLNRREIDNFPLGLDRMQEATKARLCKLTNRLMANFRHHKTRKETRYKTTGRVVYDEFNQKPAKPVVDEIDRALAKHYGFTEEELDFIINYDIKYRMGW